MVSFSEYWVRSDISYETRLLFQCVEAMWSVTPDLTIFLPVPCSGYLFCHITGISVRSSDFSTHSRIHAHHLITTSTTLNLVSLSRRLRTRTSTGTSLVASSHPQPLLRTQLQLPIQLITRILPVNEIAEASSNTSFSTIQPTASFAEIRDRG